MTAPQNDLITVSEDALIAEIQRRNPKANIVIGNGGFAFSGPPFAILFAMFVVFTLGHTMVEVARTHKPACWVQVQP